jgi:hypothetical protein
MKFLPSILSVAPLVPILISAQAFGAGKLTFDDQVELIRGLTAEHAKVKTYLPRSKKPIEYDSQGTWDKQAWLNAGEKLGPAARVGDEIQITKVTLENDKIILEINGGIKSGQHWYDHVQIGMGDATNPVSSGGGTAANGTYIAILFHKPLEPIKSVEVKKLLAPIFDFDKRSATDIYADTLPPEIKAAIAARRAEPGMDRDQVVMALGKPVRKMRETVDDVESEDWIYGAPPGKITFVTFNGNKCVKVKETYAGLGAEAAAPLDVPR